MKAIQGYHLIKPEDLFWRLSNLMQIPNADYLERTGSENLGARLWRLPPRSANTLHKHIRAEEFYFVLEGVGRLRVGDETLTVPKYGGVLVGPDQLRQVFNDTDAEVLWLIVGAPEELEFLPGAKTKPDLSLIYPVDPKQLPKELAGVEWPPKPWAAQRERAAVTSREERSGRDEVGRRSHGYRRLTRFMVRPHLHKTHGRASILSLLPARLVRAGSQALAEDAASSAVQTRVLERQAALDAATQYLRRLSRPRAMAAARAGRGKSGGPPRPGRRAAVAGRGLGEAAARFLRGVG